MSLEQLSTQISQVQGNQKKLPPVELWDPPYCGEIDIVIKADGSWFYNGTVFKRMSLVKLFASVLKREDHDYYLVTPVEKVKITVEDAPFTLTQWQWLDEKNTVMKVATNLDDTFILNEHHPLNVTQDGGLYVTVRRNLTAKVHRNVYYQWADIANEAQIDGVDCLSISSAGHDFMLGKLT